MDRIASPGRAAISGLMAAKAESFSGLRLR
jgi:hypothetical protein